MKIKDGMLYFENLGWQINFTVLLGIISTVFYFLVDELPICYLVKPIFKGVFLFEALIFFAFSILLLKKWVEEEY